MTFNQITDHLIKKRVLIAKGKKFRADHVHSIIKKEKALEMKS